MTGAITALDRTLRSLRRQTYRRWTHWDDRRRHEGKLSARTPADLELRHREVMRTGDSVSP